MSKSVLNQPVPVYYRLFCVELMYKQNEQAESVAMVNINVVHASPSYNLTGKDLTFLQQEAQKQFFARLTPEQLSEFRVVDCVFKGSIDLGLQTSNEFLSVTEESLAEGVANAAKVPAPAVFDPEAVAAQALADLERDSQ